MYMDATLLLWLTLSLVLIFVVKSIIFFVGLEWKLSNYVKVPGMPILENYFVFTNFKELLRNLMKFQARYGNVYKINAIVGFSALIISDLNILQYILGTTNILYKSYTYTFLDRWLGSGLLTSQPDKWKKSRKILTPAFHLQILEKYLSTFHFSSEMLISKLKSHIGKGPVDIYPYVTLCALDITCETTMGAKVNAQQHSESEYVKGVKELCRIIVQRTANPMKVFHCLYMFTKDYQIERRYLNVLHGFTNSVIKSRREELKENSTELGSNKQRLAFLDLLLQTTIDGRPMTEEEIRQEVDTFMFAGHDTTASGLSFILYCLSKHPNVQQRVVDEIEEVLGSNKNIAPTIKQLNEMEYLDRVIKEVLRLYPPVPVFGRSPVADTTYHGNIFPAASQLLVFAYGVHRDPKNYPDPEVFDPDRFLPENQAGRHPYSYLAFSAGPRNCIGQKFAMLEMKSCVSHILKHFLLKPVEGYEPQLVPYTVLKSMNGIQVQLEERL